jgi:hypothetical protein
MIEQGAIRFLEESCYAIGLMYLELIKVLICYRKSLKYAGFALTANLFGFYQILSAPVPGSDRRYRTTDARTTNIPVFLQAIEGVEEALGGRIH